jgi:gliding motility-associated-like protein
LTTCICLASVVVYGQSGFPTDPKGRVSETNTATGISIEQSQIIPVKSRSFNVPLIEDDDGFQEIQNGMACTTLKYYENSGVVPIEPDLSFNGVTGDEMISATVHLYYNFEPQEDSLVFQDQNGITGSYDHSQGKMELTGKASKADYLEVLKSVGYINISEDPNTSRRKVNFYINNGSCVNNFERIYIDVIPVNDPPVISGSETTLPYPAESGAIEVDNNITVTDVDNTHLLAARVSISKNYQPTEDLIAVSEQFGISITYDAPTATLIFKGSASLDDYSAILSNVTYSNSNSDPVHSYRDISYRVFDCEDSSNVFTRVIEVLPGNFPPVIVDDEGNPIDTIYVTTEEGIPVDVCVEIIDRDGNEAAISTALSQTGNGSVDDLDSLCFVYDPNPDFVGNDTLTVIVCDEGSPSKCDTVIVIVEVIPFNNPPQIVDENDIPADTLKLQVIKNVSTKILIRAIDPDNDSTKVTRIQSWTDKNTVKNNDLNDMSFTYQPNDDFTGIDTLEVIVSDTGIPSKSDSAILIVSVEPDYSTSPYAIDSDGSRIDTLYYVTDEDVPIDFCFTINNPDEEDFGISQITPSGEDTANGTMTNTDEGDFCLTYIPDENFFGQSSWVVLICNDSIPVTCDSVVVIIDVLPVNDAPVAVNDTITAMKNYTYKGIVTENDYDIEGDNLILNESPEANPLHGTVILYRDGSFDYEADPGYYGDDRFTYVICDDGDPSLCASADVVIHVEDVPLKVYNAVSPNGDDLNDYLYIEGIEFYPENFLSIYDRYNNLVYETLGYNNNNIIWQGQANKGISKRDLPGDTYFYILNPGDGTPLFKGFIMLKKE